MRTSLFRDISRPRLVGYRRCGTIYLYHLESSSHEVLDPWRRDTCVVQKRCYVIIKLSMHNVPEKREPVLKILCQIMITRMVLKFVITYAHFIWEHVALFHTVPNRGYISIMTLVLQSCKRPYQILSLFNCLLIVSP